MGKCRICGDPHCTVPDPWNTQCVNEECKRYGDNCTFVHHGRKMETWGDAIRDRVCEYCGFTWRDVFVRKGWTAFRIVEEATKAKSVSAAEEDGSE